MKRVFDDLGVFEWRVFDEGFSEIWGFSNGEGERRGGSAERDE